MFRVCSLLCSSDRVPSEPGDGLVHCNCAPADGMFACVGRHEMLCARSMLGPIAVAAIARGDIRFDSVAAEAFVASLRVDCSDQWEFASLRSVHTVAGVFTGTLRAGATCAVSSVVAPSPCADGDCDDTLQRCVADVQLGAPTDQYHACVDLDAPLRAPVGGGIQTSALVGHLPDTGTCIAWQLGDACGSDPSNARCGHLACIAGTCVEPLAVDAFCRYPGDCSSGRCSRTSGRCVAGNAAAGESCVDDAECADAVCRAGRCVSWVCAYSP